MKKLRLVILTLSNFFLLLKSFHFYMKMFISTPASGFYKLPHKKSNSSSENTKAK